MEKGTAVVSGSETGLKIYNNVSERESSNREGGTTHRGRGIRFQQKERERKRDTQNAIHQHSVLPTIANNTLLLLYTLSPSLSHTYILSLSQLSPGTTSR